MAKLSKGKAFVRPEVRRIRDRHLRAIQAGYSKEEAAAFANGDAPLRRKVKAPAPQQDNDGITKVRDITPQHRQAISGQAKAPTIPEDEPDIIEEVEEPKKEQPNPKIPKDWQDLAWPQLKSLAERFSDGEVKSRKHANEIIDGVLNRK